MVVRLSNPPALRNRAFILTQITPRFINTCMGTQFYGRKAELDRLQSFVNGSHSGFLMVRGRRRIGKSWLLTKFRDKVNAFYFQGDDDTTSRQLMKMMAEAWEAYSGDDSLAIIRVNDLSWARIFKVMVRFCQREAGSKHILIFDEIQWIAKRKSGFLGQLKEAWVDFEKSGSTKIIICGSSQRFFEKATALGTSVLHRLRTEADLWVEPFSLSEIKRHYFQKWTEEQICMVFMMTGGVPYYLERIPRIDNFIQAINQAFFTQKTIFLDELKEVLNLEFTKASGSTAEKVMKSLGPDGSTMENIRQRAGIRNESTVRTMIDQLVKYGILGEKSRAGERKANRRGSKFYIKDPFLGFYFRVLRGKARRIQKNIRSNLFAECIASKTGYYIEGFSGVAFELLTEWILQQKLSPSGTEPILDKLALTDDKYVIGHYWVEGETQLDLIVENEQDRESRVLELKWTNHTVNLSAGYISQVKNKKYTPPKGWTISYHLLLSQPASKPFNKKAKEENVQVLGLSDLFA